MTIAYQLCGQTLLAETFEKSYAREALIGRCRADGYILDFVNSYWHIYLDDESELVIFKLKYAELMSGI